MKLAWVQPTKSDSDWALPLKRSLGTLGPPFKHRPRRLAVDSHFNSNHHPPSCPSILPQCSSNQGGAEMSVSSSNSSLTKSPVSSDSQMKMEQGALSTYPST